MMFRYADPAMDAEAYFQHQSASRRMWELENYQGDCPLCGKPMFTNSSDFRDRAIENWEYDEGYVHEWCQELKDEEEMERATEGAMA